MGQDAGDAIAVVLAAGLGSRLGGDASGEATPKPLLELAGRPLLAWTLEALHAGGVGRAVIVVGHRGDVIGDAARRLAPEGLAITPVQNERYRLNNGVSVLAAAPELTGSFLLSMSDHFLGPGIVTVARDSDPGPDGAVLCIDRKIDTIFDMDDATKVKTDGDRRIRSIGKTLTDFDAIDCGVFHCSLALIDALQARLDADGDCSLSDGIGALAAAGKMYAADIGDRFWQDVDTPESMAYAAKKLPELGLAGHTLLPR